MRLLEVVCHPALKGVPFILETPNDDEGWKREIALLRERYTSERSLIHEESSELFLLVLTGAADFDAGRMQGESKI